MNIQEFAMEVPQNTKVVLYTKTLVKMNKKDVETKSIPNTFGDVYKNSTVLVTMNSSYEDRVNETRIFEGKTSDFVAQEMKYGKMVGNALLENNDQLYIKCIEESKLGESVYTLANGEVIPYTEIKPFIPASKSKSVSQDIENEVKVRNFKLSSIIGFEVK